FRLGDLYMIPGLKGSLVVGGTVIALTFGVTVSNGFEEPTGFRDIPFKSSEAHVRARFASARCDQLPPGEATMGDRRCRTQLTIGSVPVTATFVFIQDRFLLLMLSFSTQHFQTLRDTFVARYGSPTVSNEIVAYWGGTKAKVKLGRDTAFLEHVAYEPEWKKREADETRKAKRIYELGILLNLAAASRHGSSDFSSLDVARATAGLVQNELSRQTGTDWAGFGGHANDHRWMRDRRGKLQARDERD